MHDPRHHADDPAAEAIRSALPTPDADATDRIARLIADGAPRPAEATRPASRRRASRRLGVLRPALAAGAVAVAGAVALLAPGGDSASRDRGLLDLGPDAAAAEVLELAGNSIERDSWRPLADGEFHYTRSVEYSEMGRTTRTVERWLAADGTVRVRHTEEPTWLKPGDEVYTLANTCATAEDLAKPRIGEPIPGYETVPSGASIPDCWQRNVVNPLLSTASGEVVDAPPAGAFVELPVTLPGAIGGDLRYGDRVLESDAPSERPPGLGALSDGTEPVEFEPFRFAADTTWVRVEAGPRVTFDGTVNPAGRGEDAYLARSWEQAFTPEQLAALSSDTRELAAALDEAARRLPTPVLPELGDGTTARALPPSVRLDHDSTVHSLTLELLAMAPISPGTRRALFEALATQTNEQGSPARVDMDAELPSGAPAIGVSFSLSPPDGYEYPGSDDDRITMLFDPETATFLAIDLELGGSHSITAYDPPARVASMPPQQPTKLQS